MAERGNAMAYLNLGYVYSYVRCERRYWRAGVKRCAQEIA